MFFESEVKILKKDFTEFDLNFKRKIFYKQKNKFFNDIKIYLKASISRISDPRQTLVCLGG